MKISKQDARMWVDFFAQCAENGEPLMPRQLEIGYAVMSQLETAVNVQVKAKQAAIPGLKGLDGRTLYVGPDGRFPKGCRSCLTGNGLTAIRKTNRCNANCRFCYDYGVLDTVPPIGEGLWEIGGTKFREDDIDLLLRVYDKPTGVSYVYLEPFVEIEKYYGVVRKFADAGVHQHLYTNGIGCTEENLKALAEAGLDELRFNLGATNASDRVIENMRIARKYFPQVGIETPMTPEYFEAFHQKKEAILSIGLDFMNCAELHLNENNIGNYWGESFYMSRLGYLSPVWSRLLTSDLMAEADREQWDCVVHDCSNDTKFARDLHLKAKEGGWFGASSYGCEFDEIPWAAFLPAL